VSFDVAPASCSRCSARPAAGKTTTLRGIAGLEDARPVAGSPVGVQGFLRRRRAVRVAPEARGLGHGLPVVRDCAPDVFRQRLAAAGRAAPADPSDSRTIATRVEQALAVTGLATTPAGRRRSCPAGSSSGSRWPARFVVEPRVMLLDEPLSNLDATLRESMRFELKRPQRELGLTAIT